MCGICGLVGSGARLDLVQRMCGLIRHRGPDDEGYYSEDGRIVLGMRRLSVLDLYGGRQPIFNEDRSVLTVFNGEIYNFVALRGELETRGHHFATRSDTEVIVHGYEEYGLGLFEKLEGMFAAAVWDVAGHQLVLARDRVGIKPIYYCCVGGLFAFASEIKAFTCLPCFEARLDLAALDGYLTYQYVPAPLTLFHGVFKLRPGHLLVIRGTKPQPDVRPFWQFGFRDHEPVRSEGEWLEALNDALGAAVRSHLVSDVPLGAFLSGGIDSSTLVALMARGTSRAVKTFSVGFAAKEAHNELGHARSVAAYLGTDHHELVISWDMVKWLPELIWHMDEPLGDSAAMPTFFVARLAKSCGVTVALSGEGADELFAGYPKYVLDRYLELYQALPGNVRRVILAGLTWLPRFERPRRLLSRIATAPTAMERAIAWRKVGFPDHYRARLLTPQAQAVMGCVAGNLVAQHLSTADSLTRLQRMLQLDTLSWLPDDLLMKVDRMSMAASIEARVPYLDNNVVALAERLPDRLKLRGSQTKYGLKAIARKLLPESIVHRPKQGFEVPLNEWLRGDLGQYFRTLLFEGPLSTTGLFNRAYLAELLEAHQNSRVDHGARLWLLGNLSLWLTRFAIMV